MTTVESLQDRDARRLRPRSWMSLQRVCMIIAGACLVVITLIIPWGVFTRYVLGFGSSWPEPMAVLLMIWFSFMAAADLLPRAPAYRRLDPAERAHRLEARSRSAG